MSWLTDRLAATRGRRPYPLSALAVALNLDPGDLPTLADRLGMHRSWVQRIAHLGLTERQADQWATRAGLHPNQVWPDWDPLTVWGAARRNAHKDTCPAGHSYDAINSRGDRTCTSCHRRNARHWKRNRRSEHSSTEQEAV